MLYECHLDMKYIKAIRFILTYIVGVVSHQSILFGGSIDNVQILILECGALTTNNSDTSWIMEGKLMTESHCLALLRVQDWESFGIFSNL